MQRPVVLLISVESKQDATAHVLNALSAHDLAATVVDISLGSDGQVWDGARKLAAMERSAKTATARVVDISAGHAPIVLGIGGGTGSDMILRIMRGLPVEMSKLLVTTLPFDPRPVVADDSIILVPSVVDIEGLNAALRIVLDRAAGMVAGLARLPAPLAATPSVGLTTLGITGMAGVQIARRLNAAGHEVTAFHANGFGGAAFARQAREGALAAAIDMTVHEITRMVVAGTYVQMPDRFSAAGHIPRVVLPGGMNVIGLGAINSIPQHLLDRAHYRHSEHFTHVKMGPEEMERASAALADALNKATAPTTVMIPMEGFSSEDRAGGAIEDRDLRAIAADLLDARAVNYRVVRTAAHISSPETADQAVRILLESL